MSVTKTTYQKLSPAVRSIYGKAKEVLAQGNLEYGITLLKDIVVMVPGFEEARNDLRVAEKKKTLAMGTFGKIIAGMRQSGDLVKASAVLKRDPMEALHFAEEACAKLLNKKALLVLASAAMEAEYYTLAVKTYDLILEENKTDEAVLGLLEAPLMELKDYGRLVQVRQTLCSLHPQDLDYQQALREAGAMASLNTAKFIDDDNGATKSSVPGSTAPNTEDLERGDRIIRAEEDIRELISRFEKNIAAGQGSLDNYRKVAELYYRIGRYQDTINAYTKLVELQGNLDPVIDREIEKAQVALAGENIRKMEEANTPAEQVNAEKQALAAYRLERAENRVRLYPNDLQMRFELAERYWENGSFDQAIEQFQHSRRNPQRKLSSIVYLGRCLNAKGQYDMAVDQFNEALAGMPVMDKDKLLALYCKGESLEALGRKDEALECFKLIYSTDVSFADVAKRIDAYYKTKSAQA